ncbi:MAG TPA: hypothetical protein PKI20_19185 [Verrucomicrobiota bacterium]|nr:hypothetical protein [Verrucomicrobiota bacterium]HQL79902.1 hypothetical protein [Verrucomicrobiota bacterium]
MESAVQSRLQSVQFGEAQTYKNITVLPLIAPADGRFQYCTLGEALGTWGVAITEVSAAGSVPDLMVVNRGNKPVLLIDGEELAGAKQNRVLNTSILIKEISETRIPVSCTEQGRWSYASRAFAESGNVMAHKARARKTRSVHESLQAFGVHKSDQGEVWDEVAELQRKACCMSPTSAMSDVYKARDEDLKKCDEIFKSVANQIGFVAFIGGKPAGLDMVSLTSAYARLHPKLVRSYALEALIEVPPSTPGGKGKGKAAPESAPGTPHSELARAFLAEIAAAEERQFASVGHGTDYRYRSKSGPSTPTPRPSTICGTALVHENEVIHAAFFRLDDPEQPAHMASYRNRRRRYE